MVSERSDGGRRCLIMDALTDGLTLFLFAVDFLLAVILLDAEREDEPRRRLERVEARRQALRQRELDREQ
jgi:hypothetical protein